MVYNGKVFTKIRKGGAKCNKSESISLSSLPVDTLTVTVVDERHWDFPLANADDQLLYVSEGSVSKYPSISFLMSWAFTGSNPEKGSSNMSSEGRWATVVMNWTF